MGRTVDEYAIKVDTRGARASLIGLKTAFAGIAAAAAAIGLERFGSAVIEATTQMEGFRTTLTTYLGSQEKANQALERMQVLANRLPQSLTDVTKAFTIFTRSGVNTSSQAITNLSNIATANGKSLTQLAEAFADSITGEFERLKEFGIKVSNENGVLTARIGQDIVAVGDNATELTEKLVKLGGTKFGGAAAANAGTLSQSLSNLSGAVNTTLVSIGTGLTPALRELADELAAVLRANQDLAKEFGVNLGDAFKAGAAAASFLVENLKALTIALSAIIGLRLAVAIAGIVTALGAFINSLLVTAAATATLNASLGATVVTGAGIARVGGAFAAWLGPIGIAIAAIVTATTAVILLDDKTVKLGETTTTYGQITEAVFDKVRRGLGSIENVIIKDLMAAFDRITKQVIRFGEAFNWLTGILTKNIEFRGFGRGVEGAAESISNSVKKIYGAAKGSIFGGIEEEVKRLQDANVQAEVAWALSRSRLKTETDMSEIAASMDRAKDKALVTQGKISDLAVAEWTQAQKALQTFKDTNAEFERQFSFKTSLIGLTDDQTRVAQALFDVESRKSAALAPLLLREAELIEKKGQGYIAQIGAIRAVISITELQFNSELEGVNKIADARNEALKTQEKLLNIENARIAVTQSIAEIQSRADRARESVTLAGLKGLKRELEAIKLEENRIAEAAKARIKEQFKGADASKILAELARIDAASAEAIKGRQKAAEDIDAIKNKQRTFADGWSDAFEEYAKNAADAGAAAERAFTTSAKGMEDAIVGFAKTGKFEFRGLMSDIVETILRSNIQQLIGGLGGTTGGAIGGGSIIGGLGSLFSGFFATGGMIPPGRFGVVGEAGAELVQGPATVTPLGSSTVTYNINAVDAASFKAMIARDPAFIHSVAEAGRQTIPSRRR
jgi:lambda family phage tail tape measure protein